MKKRLVYIITFMGVLIISFFVLTISMTKDQLNRQYYMYTDIEALDVLSQYIVVQIEDDKYLNDLVPVERLTCNVKWEEKSYSVYAYVFENSTQCKQYVTNRMQKSFDDNNSYYLTGNGLFKTRYIAISDNKLLYIDGPDIKSTYNFLDFIQQDFDINLKDMD